MKNKKVLISGASIAGPVLAWWLARYGFEVVVVEKSDTLRLDGQNIDVKGPAREIIARMGLEDSVRRANTTEVGIRFVNTNNKTLAEFPKESALSMTQELEILRGDFVQILYEATKDKAEYRFGDYITGYEEGPENLKVRFAGGREETFDLAVIAEGIGSATRNMIMDNEVDFKYLGLYTTYLTMEREATESNWARWCNATRGIVYLLRPDNHGTTRACINFRSPEMGYESLPIAEQKKTVIQKISGTGWESGRLARAIQKSDDLYLERLSQVKLPVWSKGRFAIIGDAAYCVTPIGGAGTDLAVTGAYLLAGELHKNAEFKPAFEAYEKKLRPFVDKVQKLPPGVPRLVYPKSRIGVGILNAAFRIAGSRFVQNVIRKLSGGNKKEQSPFTVPDYD